MHKSKRLTKVLHSNTILTAIETRVKLNKNKPQGNSNKLPRLMDACQTPRRRNSTTLDRSISMETKVPDLEEWAEWEAWGSTLVSYLR